MLLSAAVSGFIAAAGLIIAIGAQNAFVLRQGLQQRHVGLVVLVCMMGDIVLIIAGVAGIGALVQQWPWLLQLLRFGGAAFLAIYGLLAARRAITGGGELAPANAAKQHWRLVLLTALAFTFLNPHVYLDTMVLLGSLSTRYPVETRWAFAVGACCASTAWFSALGFGARLLRPVFRNPKAWRVLDTIMAIFMFALSLLLLLKPLKVG
ncbi:amino acid transporter [Stenotrophomonas sp. SAM-B]|uniref:LysE/ArgO family amino acid transporter n=1 Tax=Stenotrophomonas sp. SAM-B TaxID=2729141 RepID=UPI0015A0FC03|nr:LysE/ArgO family amino acid transporter [Stenotrophomonas sp. SAM-B]NWF32303.1 amino acid transporter [Stenotrophomonas sp. SAM-B]